ncbi:hypothetical protein DPEC_G00278280 [Dallia pectoralis]|uniref:Uncharacterized protein n=1 Tax=Dallia pectoralis TaxID=75939 RepID=A0ACC2FM40_DALPE|nr:hypothetical protein DPEC_G00278280 [Dallia pectoralis]
MINERLFRGTVSSIWPAVNELVGPRGWMRTVLMDEPGRGHSGKQGRQVFKGVHAEALVISKEVASHMVMDCRVMKVDTALGFRGDNFAERHRLN